MAQLLLSYYAFVVGLMPNSWLVIYCVILGLCIGSFLNVVAYRLPIMAKRRKFIRDTGPLDRPFNLNEPRSACPGCGHSITARENIPVVSWLLLLGKCSDCKCRISFIYPFVEILTGVVFGLIAYSGVPLLQLITLYVSASSLIVIVMIGLGRNSVPKSILVIFIVSVIASLISGQM